MSSSGIPIVQDAARFGKKLLAPDVNVSQAPLPERSPAAAAPKDPEIEKRASEQFETRRQEIQRSATAAGAQRSENQVDLLGYSPPKQRNARRTLGVL